MSAKRPEECLHCGMTLTQTEFGRPRNYCSNACRQAAYRLRMRLGIAA